MKRCLLLFCFSILLFFNSSIEAENLKSGSDKRAVDLKKREKALNYIFDTGAVPTITLQIPADSWNEIVENSWNKNELYPECCGNEIMSRADFTFKKGRKIETVSNIGLRTRGNTSRHAPGTYYDSTNDRIDKYNQAHFRIDFNEFQDKNEPDKDLKYLKALILKYCKDDPSYVREMYAYNLFRDFGVWTSPRISYCKLYVKVKNLAPVYYGVYLMIEPVDKTFLKTRFKNSSKSSKGYLWKNLWGSVMTEESYSGDSIQIEDPDGDGLNNYDPRYDLKTNKKKFAVAKKDLIDFIDKLNSVEDGDEFKKWIESNFDVDLFLKMYAVNSIVGMWDDIGLNNKRSN